MAGASREQRKALRQSFDRRALDRVAKTASTHYVRGGLTPEGRRLEAERDRRVRTANFGDDLRRVGWLVGTLAVAFLVVLLGEGTAVQDTTLGLGFFMAVASIAIVGRSFVKANERHQVKETSHRQILDAAQRWSLLTEDEQRVLRRSATARNRLADGGFAALRLFLGGLGDVGDFADLGDAAD